MWLRPRSSYVSAIGINSNETTFEADSHADTTCLGRGALPIFDYETPVNVQGYDPALGSKQYSIISGALDYIQPHTGVKYHLIIHQAAHVPDLDHHLLCPMQCRANDVTVNDCPRIHCQNPTEESHSVVATDENGDRVILPFFLRGVTSHFNVESISKQEFERHLCPRIVLTNRDLTWDPSSTVYEDQENAMIDYKGEIIRPNTSARGPLMSINSLCVSTNSDTADVSADCNLGNVLAAQVCKRII